MGWIVGIRSTRTTPVLLEARGGDVREVSAVDADLDISDRPKIKRTRVFEVDLAAFERLSVLEAKAVVATMGIPEPVANTQSFWVLRDGSRRIFVPSQVFIHALLGKTRAHRSALFSPARYQLLATLVEGDSGLTVSFPAPFEKRSPERAVGLVPTILWTSTYDSAMRMHSSVLRYAMNRRFDLDLPRARATVAFAGEEVQGGNMLVTSMRLAAVEPLEPPMPHAEGLVPTRFTFAVIAHTRLKSSRQRGPKELSADPTLSSGRFATPLEDSEWESLRDVMLSRCTFKRRIGQIEREKVNIILRKLSTGAPWATAATSVAQAKRAWAYFDFLRANGLWDVIRAFVLESRGSQPREEVDVAVGVARTLSAESDAQFQPEQIRYLRTRVAKVSQARFGALLGVSGALVSLWERGAWSPKGAAADRLRLLASEGVQALE